MRLRLPLQAHLICGRRHTPCGDLDGFLLTDGTQVHVPPHLSTQLAAVVRPGAQVAFRNDQSNGHRSRTSRVQTPLYGQAGDLNGAVLEDGTIIRLPPSIAAPSANLLEAGQIIAVQGRMLSTTYGRVIDAQTISPAPTPTVVLPPPSAGVIAPPGFSESRAGRGHIPLQNRAQVFNEWHLFVESANRSPSFAGSKFGPAFGLRDYGAIPHPARLAELFPCRR